LKRLGDNAAPLALARMVPDSMEHPSIAPLRTAQRYFEEFVGPIAGVWGEEDPILGGVARWVEKLRPDIRMIYTSAGHFLQEEVPGPIADAIRYVDARR
jgi:haloalkane dehalogenase